ncbi:SigE family RNA polymerase sigma factor [Nocardioides sp. GXZ039]|uniref:SigE family RNA polymerase sigma factor n=1 Tax=Nocardioides sp. GXZ039 TaxID=3136018 RepID=UPI0030F46EA9
MDLSDFDSWVAARGPALLRLAYTLTGDAGEAEDVVQEALSRALPRWERISRVEDVDAYVRRMVLNAHTSRWRAWRRRVTPVERVADRAVMATPDRPDHVEHDERLRIWAACLALPEAQRVAVVLRYYEQLEYAEIAALTGVREGSVRSRVSRGLAALRAELGRSASDEEEES